MRDQVQLFVSGCKDLEDAAARLGVRPSTLRKVLEGADLSPPSQKRLVALLNNQDLREGASARSALATERLRTVHSLYTQLGTLEAAGRKLNLTRERVRQLLVKGTKRGLFEYRPRDYPYIAKEKLLQDYRGRPNLGDTARENNVPVAYVRKLLTAYSVTKHELRAEANNGRRAQCMRQYQRIMGRLGHHPSTTELQSSPEGHSLHMRILRLWGSIDTFRDALNIPPRPKGNPRFKENVAAWRENQRRLGFVVRMQQLDDIRDHLTVSGPMRASDIASGCGLNLNRARLLLGLLVSAGEVRRHGIGSAMKYVLRSKVG